MAKRDWVDIGSYIHVCFCTECFHLTLKKICNRFWYVEVDCEFGGPLISSWAVNCEVNSRVLNVMWEFEFQVWGQKWCLVWAWVCWWVCELVRVEAKMGRISAGSGSQQVKRRSRLSERATTDFISRGLLDQQPLPPSLVSCAPPLSPVHIPSSLFSP